MFQLLLYFIIALFATTVGASTGMGGGVIMKPVLDVLHQFDVATINLLSSITVFAMALVSVLKHLRNKTKIEASVALPLALGSIAGGLLGDFGISWVISLFTLDKTVLLLQNSILAAIIVGVFFYIRNKEKLPTLGLKGILPSLATGLFLGAVSSFLGIGGGPVNVALIIFVFSYNTKTAAVSSLVIILFAQLAKLGAMAASGGFGGYNLSVLPAMVLGAVLGGWCGSLLHSALPEKKVDTLFNGVQILVFCICVFNIIRNI